MGEETGRVLRGLWQPEECSTGGQNTHRTKEAHLGVPLQSPAWFLFFFFIDLFIFGCVGSSFLCEGFL